MSTTFLECLLTHRGMPQLIGTKCEYYSNENELLDAFIRLFHEWDPDMLVGYEVISDEK